MGAVGLYTHIQANNVRSALLLCGFPVLLLVIVYFLTLGGIGAGYLPPPQEPGGELAEAAGFMLAAAPLALIVSGIWFVIAYFANQAIIDLATGAHQVTRTEEPELYNLLENLCISRGIKTPTLRVIESEGLNAFATGLNEKQYSITVTRGLMQTMTPDEIEAVLGHELTHVLNRDVRTMVIASVFAGIITLIAQILYRSIMWGGAGRRGGDRKGGGGIWIVVALAAAAIGYVLAIVIRMALSRSREFVADAGSVELTKNPDAMISALQKISGHAHLDAPESVRSMFLEDDSAGVMGLFATHPPIAKRIEALVKFAGGRVAELPEPAAVAPVEGPWSDPPASPPATGPWG
jgi:heat shock protein HtpX